MTILNAISAVIFIAIIVVIVVLFRKFRKETDAACGFESVNERGEIGTSHEGDIIIDLSSDQ